MIKYVINMNIGKNTRILLVFTALISTIWTSAFSAAGNQNLHTVNTNVNVLSKTWIQLNEAVSPANRTTDAFSWNIGHNYGILFGGYSGNIMYGDTWKFQNNMWSQVYPINSPSPRRGSAMAFDPTLNGLVLFSGYGNSFANDTWFWNSTQNNWINIPTQHAPLPRRSASLVYDKIDGYLLLFGGHGTTSGNNVYYNETWVFNGIDWTQLSITSNVPSPRAEAGTSYDPILKEIVLFGGYIQHPGGSETMLGDTWTYSNGIWTQLITSVAPSPRDTTGMMVWDNALKKIVLFGDDSAGPSTNDTWTWDGNWIKLHPTNAPLPENGGGLAYYPGGDEIIQFGGGLQGKQIILHPGNGAHTLNATWVYR